MASFPILGPNATLAERQAAAAFFIATQTFPLFSRGQVLTEDGRKFIIDGALQVAAAGDGPDAAAIRQVLEGLVPPSER